MLKQLLSVSLVLVCASTSFGLVVSDFEDSNSLGQWENNTWIVPPGELAASTVGVTSGVQSMEINIPTNLAYEIAAMLKFSGVLDPNTELPAMKRAWKNSATVECDFTFDPNDWVGTDTSDPNTNWVNVALLSNSQNGGWASLPVISDDVNPNTPGGWDPINYPELNTRHVVYDLSAVNEAMNAAGGPGDWFELFVIIQMGSAWENGGKFYIDNVTLNEGPKKIILVTETQDADEDGIYDDEAWIDLLTEAGYDVEAPRDRYLTMGDDKDVNDANDYVAELNAADLVIISRSASSGDYANDANEIKAWNDLTSPLICLSAYHIRSSRLKWLDSSSQNSDNLMPYALPADANHPIFADANIVDGMVNMVDTGIYGEGYQGTTFVNIDNVGNGTLLASHLAEYPWIAEWERGTEYYDGSGEIAGNKRMMFMAGTQETRPTYPQGDLNLTDDGVLVFLNAVDYMINTPLLVNGSFEQPGVGKINLWDGGTNGKGTFVDVPGWSSDTMAEDSGVETGWDATDGEYTGFMKGADPSIWQLTNHVLGANDYLTLSVNAKNNWAATTLQLTIYVDFGGVRLPIISEDFELTDTMAPYSLSFDAQTAPEMVGSVIGVELNNVTEEGGSWIGFDEVVLTVE